MNREAPVWRSELPRYYWALGLISLFLLFAFTHEMSGPILRYDREAIARGEYWRLLTGNWVHLSWGHALMNIGALLLVPGLFGRFLTTRVWLFLVVVISLWVSGSLYAWNPDLQWYVGFSGTLHGLFVAGIFASVVAGNRAELLLLFFLIVKLGYEQGYGALPGSEATAGGRVLVDAHLYGALAGLIYGMVHYCVATLRLKARKL